MSALQAATRRFAAVAFVATAVLTAACDAEYTLGLERDDTAPFCCFDEALQQKVSTCTGARCTCDPSLCGAGGACLADEDCPTSGIACAACADGTDSCAVVRCVDRRCRTTPPACAPTPCQTDLECPGISLGTCKPCADGTCATYARRCRAGSCVLESDACAPPACRMPSACPALSCATTCPRGVRRTADGCETCDCLAAGETQTFAPGLCVPPAGACVACLTGPSPIVCAQASCDGDVCRVQFAACPPPGYCDDASTCPMSTVSCAFCLDTGTEVCPMPTCIDHQCGQTTPRCP